ncbi:MAG: hypothetical protein MUC99_13025 [Anaerolineae bacterium]|nr:hypothetical protein [Anaerolineae bacterium]
MTALWPDVLSTVLTDSSFMVVERAAEAAERLGLRLGLVGGAVRDALLGVSTLDLDFIVRANRPASPRSAPPNGCRPKASAISNTSISPVRAPSCTRIRARSRPCSPPKSRTTCGGVISRSTQWS